MPRVLGYGGVGNTNGTRSFSGKAAASTTDFDKLIRRGHEYTEAGANYTTNTLTRTIARRYQFAIATMLAMLRPRWSW